MTFNEALPQVVNLQESNPALGGLLTKEYDKSYKPVPNRVLPASMKQQLNACYQVLTGKQLEPESYTIAVKSVNGAFSGFYTPSVYQGEGENELILTWGDEKIALQGISTPNAKYLCPKNVSDIEGLTEVWQPSSNNDTEAVLTFSANKTVRGIDTTLKLTVYTPEYPSGLEMCFTAWLTDSEDFEGVDSEKLNQFLKRGQFGLVRKALTPPLERFKGDNIPLAEFSIGTYKVTNFRVYQGKFGPSVLAQIAPPTEAELEADPNMIPLADYVTTWLNGNIGSIMIANNPKLSESSYAKLYVTSISPAQGRKKAKAEAAIVLPKSAIAPSDLLLDF